jgi:hypothetical protein
VKTRSSTASPSPHARTGSVDPARTSPLAFFITLGLIMAITEAVLFMFFHKRAVSPADPAPATQVPTNIKTVSTPILLPTTTIPSATFSNCIPWSALTRNDVGDSVCVFGRIVDIYSAGEYKEIIRFSREAGTFLIWDRESYVNLEVWQCIKATGIVHQDASELFMYVSETEFEQYSDCP